MSPFAAPLVAEHLALELLNSEPVENGERIDYLGSDAVANQWIGQATGSTLKDNEVAPSRLAQSARDLRQVIRTLVERRKAGRHPDLDGLNAWLATMPSHLAVVRTKNVAAVERVRGGSAVSRLLAPFAEAAADLVVDGDFQLVRQCEHPDCVLWFYDRTKAHRRRWCSMAVCGNRHKVSEYRKRKSA